MTKPVNINREDAGRLVRFVLREKLQHAPWNGEFIRAGGECLCPHCGFIYFRHPRDPHESDLTILCDGSRVKL